MLSNSVYPITLLHAIHSFLLFLMCSHYFSPSLFVCCHLLCCLSPYIIFYFFFVVTSSLANFVLNFLGDIKNAEARLFVKLAHCITMTAQVQHQHVLLIRHLITSNNHVLASIVSISCHGVQPVSRHKREKRSQQDL